MVDLPAGSVRERIEQDELFLDSAVVSHGFAPFLRDYDVVIHVPAAKPDAPGSYVEGAYRYRFTHCPEVHAHTTVDPASWQKAWDDLFTDYAAWEAAGTPPGFVWGVRSADAYPGLSYVRDSENARRWSQQLGHEMHEARIEASPWEIRIVFHDLQVSRLAAGDPSTGELIDQTE